MARIAVVAAALLLSHPAAGQDGPVGPCSPYRAADGDVPSEMPGCVRRRRSAPGSLSDEMEFRRARHGDEARGDEAVPDDDADFAPRRRVHRPRRGRAD